MTRQEIKEQMIKALPDRVIFSRAVGSPSAAIGQALDSLEDGAVLEKVADRLVSSLGWDGSPAFWQILEQYKQQLQ